MTPQDPNMGDSAAAAAAAAADSASASPVPVPVPVPVTVPGAQTSDIDELLRLLVSAPPAAPGAGRAAGRRGAVESLLAVASHFRHRRRRPPLADAGAGAGAEEGEEEEATDDERCRLYLRCIATHRAEVEDDIRAGIDLGAVAAVVKAAGTAATRLRDGRSGVARSGVIPALASIAAAYQERPASDRGSGKSDGHGDGDGDAAMADADADADAAAGPVPVPVLTPAHPELLQCCLLAGHCRAAARLAGTVPVRTVDGTGTAGAVGAPPPGPPPARTRPAALPGVTSDTYLRYFYYLGRVRVGCDDVVGALAAFSVCLSAPAHLVSAVAVAARKKMVLCRCLASPPLSGPLGVGADADSDRMRRARAKLRRDITSVPPSVSPFVAEYIGSASGGTAAASLSGGGGGRGGGGGGGEAITSAKRSRGYDNDGNDVVMEGGEGTTGGGAEGSGERSQQQQRGGDDGGETKMAVEVEVEMEEPELSAGMPPEDADRSQPQQPPVSDRFRRDMNHHNLGRYEMLADAFASSDRVAFRSLREGMTDLLRLDGNASLAERVEQWMNTRAVYAVAAVYEVASLSDVANEMGLEGGAAEAERMVRDAVAASSLSPSAPHLSARIDQESGMVSFDAHADVYGDESDDDDDDDGTYRTGLASQMRQCFELAERIRLLDTQVTTSGKYQDILARKERNAKNASQVGDGGKNSAGPRGVADLGGFDDENTE